MADVANPEAGQTGAHPGAFIDPYRAYNFKLMIQGVTEGHFTACTGLGVKVEVIKYREGGTNQVVHCIPGQVNYADVTLRYGLTSSHEVWDWLMAAMTGKVERKNVSILMLDSSGVTEVMRWDLINAWPTEWHGAALDALNREVAIETLTLVYETLQRA
jgi:phage tail-like protein